MSWPCNVDKGAERAAYWARVNAARYHSNVIYGRGLPLALPPLPPGSQGAPIVKTYPARLYGKISDPGPIVAPGGPQPRRYVCPSEAGGWDVIERPSGLPLTWDPFTTEEEARAWMSIYEADAPAAWDIREPYYYTDARNRCKRVRRYMPGWGLQCFLDKGHADVCHF
jgi:hypothetical protein